MVLSGQSYSLIDSPPSAHRPQTADRRHTPQVLLESTTICGLQFCSLTGLCIIPTVIIVVPSVTVVIIALLLITLTLIVGSWLIRVLLSARLLVQVSVRLLVLLSARLLVQVSARLLFQRVYNPFHRVAARVSG